MIEINMKPDLRVRHTGDRRQATAYKPAAGAHLNRNADHAQAGLHGLPAER